MTIFEKMLSGLYNSVNSIKANDTELIRYMKTALDELAVLLKGTSSYIKPETADEFEQKWRPVYLAAQERTDKLFYRIGLAGAELKRTTKRFLAEFDYLEETIARHNDRIASEKVLVASRLICPVEGRDLDAQQLMCIVKDARSHLVLAGAGSGKTTTIVGYVKYLLISGKCSPEKILVLSFTNASAAEMKERLAKETGTDMDVSTFHKLGMNIITAVEHRKPDIAKTELRAYVRKQLDTLIADREYLLKLCLYLVYEGVSQKSEFDFETREEYETYLTYNPPVTLLKETVKSYGELDIANFLTQNGIRYEYEKAYPVNTATDEYGQYHPDFYLPDYDIWIEYFGINRKGEVPSYFEAKGDMTPSETYRQGMEWKRELHRGNETILIETYAYEKLEECLLINLAERLKQHGVVFQPQAPEELWNNIRQGSNNTLDRIAELFATIINLVKNNEITLDELRDRNHKTVDLKSTEILIDLVEPVYNQYQQDLTAHGEIDFNDMINKAAKYVSAGKYQHPYEYVIIDEYQDISQSRFRLISAMRESRDFKLFCVGDDWQSIYRFSGSDVGLTFHFDKYWGPSMHSRIETTYRFPQSLIEISGEFVMRNPNQLQKSLKSAISASSFSMEKIVGYNEDYAVEFMAERIRTLPRAKTVLLLGRYRFDIRMLDRSPVFEYRYDNASGETIVVHKKRPDLRIRFMTAHGSKGLQADYVFLLNTKKFGMGFPSQIADAQILNLLLDNSDSYPFAEERRLFYVAITRAKEKVWFVTLKGNESAFVGEIDEVHGEEMKAEMFTCPECGGKLIRKHGKNGDFIGCSNYSVNGCRYTRSLVGKK